MQNVLGALRPVVVALIASAALSIVQVAAVKSGGGVSIVGIVLMVAAFLVLRWKKWNPILVMLLCGVGGAAARGRLAVTKIFRNHLSALDRDWCVCYTPN